MSQYAHETRILSETRTEALRKYEYEEELTHSNLHLKYSRCDERLHVYSKETSYFFQ